MRNFQHVEQLFDYGGAIRKIMYTTNAVERTHSSFKKVTKKRTLPNENAFCVLKNWKTKWDGGRIQNWAMVRNQLLLHDELKDKASRYLE